MAMATGGRNKAEMNVTPLIDVLLVLLIIAMVILPSTHGLKTVVPPSGDSKAATPRDDIVITVLRDHTVRLNQELVALGDLDRRLRELSALHHVIFVRGGKDLDFQQVAEIIDIAKGAGLEKVGLMPE